MGDIKQALKDFVATANSGNYANEDEIFSKFPEFNGYDRQLLKDFVATANEGNYDTEEELFAKFPEFNIDVKKKDQSQTGYDQTQPGSGSKTAPSSNRSFAGSIDYLDQAPKFGEIPGAPKVPGTEGVVPTQKKQPKRTIVRGEEADQAIAESLTPQAAVAESTQPMSLQSKYKNVEKLETANDKIIETFQSENRTNKFSPKDIEKNYNEYAKNALDDYLDYLNFTDRGGSTYQKTKEQLDYYRSLGDKLFNDEQYADDYKRYLDLQQEAILNVNKQDAKYVNRLKTKYDWDTFNKKTSEVELKLSNIENQIKNISSDSGPLTPLEQKKYDDLLKQYNQIQTDYTNFSNELGITEDVINQMSNSASRLAASQKAVNSIENEDTVNSKRLKEYKAQLLSNKKAQEEFYGDKDQAWYEQFGKGILNAGEQLGSSLIKGSISMVGDVPQLLTDAIGFEGYGVTDRLAEAADNINSYVDLVAPQLDDKDFPGFVKASGIIGNGLGSVGTFLLAGGGSTKAAQGILRTSTAKGLQTANRVGTFTAASSISAGQMYDQLIEEGFNPTEASRYALAGGIVMGAAEMIVPEDQLLKNTVRRTFIGALRSKSTLKEASQEALKFVYNRSTDVLKNNLKEGGEEAVGQLAQDFSLQAASSLSGKEVDGLWEVQPYVDNFLAGGGVGGVIELLKFGTRNSKYANKFKESMLLELADNYDDISNKMSQINPEDFNTIGEKYAKLKNVNNALKDIPGFEDLSHADKSHILALAYNKQVILDSIKQSGLDKSNFEKELTTIEEEIQATLNKPKDAVQKPSTEEVLPRQQGETTETGGQPQGMGPSVQGQEATQEGETEEHRQERIAKEASAGAAEVVTELNAPNALAASVFSVVGEVEAQIEKGEFVSDEKSTEAQDKLYELLGDIDAREDLTPEQKQRMSAVIENRIQKIQDYDYRTRTETSTTTQTVAAGTTPKAQKQNERAAIPVRTVAEEGIDVTYDGRPGRIELRDGEYVFVPKKLGAVQARPVVIGEAAQVNAGSKFAGVENPTTGPNNSVANITLPNGSTLSVLNDDLSIDIGLEIAKQEVGAAPQALFDTVFEEVVTENKVEVPYLRETKPAQEQAATTQQTTEQVTEQAPTNIPPSTQQAQAQEQAPATEEKPAYTGNTTQDRALKDKYKADNLKRRILDQAQRIASALGKNTQVYVYETTEEYNKAIAERLGEDQKESTNGRFLYGDGVSEIHIDLSKANEKTLPHEAVHAVLYKAFGENEKLFQQFKDKLKPLLANSTVAELENFANQETYVRQGVTAEEFLAELGGVMTAAGNRIPKTTLQKITQLLNEFLSKITGGRIAPLSTGEVIDLFNSMAEAFASGKTVDVKTSTVRKSNDGSIASRSQVEKLFKGKTPVFKSLTDIANYLQAWVDDNKLFDDTIENVNDEEIVKKFTDHILKEIKAWEEIKGDEYIGFYDEDIPQRLNPELQKFAKERYGRELTNEEVSLYHIVSAFASPSADPEFDSSKGLEVFDKYMTSGILTGYSNEQATEWEEGPKGKYDTGRPKFDEQGNVVYKQIAMAYAVDSLEKFNEILNHFNGDISKAVNWVLSKHTYNEVSDMLGKPKTGPKAISENEYFDKENGGMGVFGITGVKLGSYILNRIGDYSTVTKDMWYARTLARLAGESLTEKGKAIKSPWKLTKAGLRKRKLADKAFGDVAKKLNTTPADIQQKLWDFEKRLYEKLGAVEKASYASDGFKKKAKELSKEKVNLKSKSQASNLVEKAGISSNMTEDDQGNYLFYHYSPNKISSIDPKYFGRNIRTGRDERPGMNISMYYTSPDVKDVSGDFGYVVRIPKDKVYPFNKDPLNLYDKAKEAFNKKFPGQAFDPNKQVAFISAEAAKLGYPMTVAKWNSGDLRAQTTEKMVGEVYTKPAKGGGVDINEDIAQFKVNKKARRSKLKSKSQIEVDPKEIQANSEAKLNEVINGDPESGATFNLDGTTYDGGGLVIPITSVNVDTDKISTQDISDMVEDNIDKIFDDQKVKTGIYKFTDGKQMSVDLNIIVPSEQVEFAKEFARAAGQESIFSLDTYENIKTGSTGENPIDFSADEFLEIAQALNEGRLPNIERLEYKPEFKSKSQVSAIPKATTESKDMMSEFDMAANKTGLAKENSVRRFVEKYGEKGLVAKEINDNFEKIQEQLGITKICNI